MVVPPGGAAETSQLEILLPDAAVREFKFVDGDSWKLVSSSAVSIGDAAFLPPLPWHCAWCLPRAELGLEHRRKGLVWFSTYAVNFNASYVLENTGPVRESLRFKMPLPDRKGTYSGLQVSVDNKLQNVDLDSLRGLLVQVEIAPGERRTVQVRYDTRGLDEWRHRPARRGAAVAQLSVQVRTNFSDLDFPARTLSPTTVVLRDEPVGEHLEGRVLQWQATNMLTNKDIAVVMLARLNPGAVAARMSYFAPVGLLFFFAFLLLFAYLVGVFEAWVAFALAALVSVVLVSAYLAVALGREYPRIGGALGQLVCLVLFSYSFFWPGATGLTVTIGAVLTRAILMVLTARTNWDEMFRRSPAGADAQHQPSPNTGAEDLPLDIDLPDTP